MRTTCLIVISLISTHLLLAGPTEQRKWRSTAGTTIEAAALALEEGEVELESADGRVFKVPVDKFVEEDQKFLTEHFMDGEEEEPSGPKAIGSKVELIKDGLEQPIGEVSGPIKAGKDSTYFVYVPTTLRKGREAPLMFITGASGGSAGSVKKYIEGAELNGMVLAASVESKNGEDHPEGNHEHAKSCVEHLLSTLPIDKNRVFFSGNSGGGAMSFYNASRITSAGVMPIVGYAPDNELNDKGFCFAIGGTTDYNRYLTASAVARFGDDGIHRFFAGGHANGPDYLGVEGITWLNGRFLGENREMVYLEDELIDFEVAMIDWIVKLRKSHEHRAHYWCVFLLDEYQIAEPNRDIVDGLLKELDEDPGNEGYTRGIDELNFFSNEHYSFEGEDGGSKFEHTSDELRKAAEKVAKDFEGVPVIEEIVKSLGEPTVGK